MISLLLSVVAVSPAQPPATHASANPLLKQLLDPGLSIGGGLRAKLPPPSMTDGLDAAHQEAAIRAAIGSDYSFEEFTRKSVVAPQLLRIRDIKPSDPLAPARRVDAWFIAYGDFKLTEDEKFLDRLLKAGREGGGSGSNGGALSNEDLTKRHIALPPGERKAEHYGYVTFDFLDRVRIRATGRSVWSRTPESAVVAAEVDPRFTGDKDFPNEWRPLVRGDGGVTAGPAKPWSGAGFYLKITKLKAIEGAMFVEMHVVFVEPVGWFEGANLLRSKLPIAMQTVVRNMRREWVKGK